MLKGLPASGKSTWAKEKTKSGGNCMIVSKDTIRETLGGYTQRREKDVVKIRNQLIRTGIELGKNVIVDDTNLNPVHEKTIRQLAKELGATFQVEDSFLDVPVEECIVRDLHRGEKAIGASAIWETYYKWLVPTPVKKLDNEWEKRRCVIFDVDGTLAINTSGRDYYDMARVDEDTPDPFLSFIADCIDGSGDYYADIILVSGRNEAGREKTEKWLKDNAIPYKALYMRKEGDTRKDSIVKMEIYHNEIEPNYAVLGVFDDRNAVCDEWRKLGLRVAQVGNPHINF